LEKGARKKKERVVIEVKIRVIRNRIKKTEGKK